MNANDMVEASLSRAEAALASHDLAALAMAELSLQGCLDWAARQTGDEALVRAVLAAVSQELRS